MNAPGTSTATAANAVRIIKRKVSGNIDLEEFLKNQTLPTEVTRTIHRGSSKEIQLNQPTQHIRSMTAVLPPVSAKTSNHNADQAISNSSSVLLIGQ